MSPDGGSGRVSRGNLPNRRPRDSPRHRPVRRRGRNGGAIGAERLGEDDFTQNGKPAGGAHGWRSTVRRQARQGLGPDSTAAAYGLRDPRSEERRVGKERRS